MNKHTQNIRVASIQYEPVPKDKETNIANLALLAREAAEAGAKLIVSPEMATTGYVWSNRADIEAYVETIPGETTDFFAKLCAELEIYLVIGMPEKDAITDIYYNSSVLIEPSGKVHRYRKVHPYMAEPYWAKNGDEGFQVIATPIGNIGMLICMDLTFCESAVTLKKKGCNILVSPVNWFGAERPDGIWICRALENEIPLIVSNRWGSEGGTDFIGASCIIDQNGKVVSELITGNGFVSAELEVPSSLTYDETKYPDLHLSTHQWNPFEFYSKFSPSFPSGKNFFCTVYNISSDLVEASVEKKVEYLRGEMEESSSQMLVFPGHFFGLDSVSELTCLLTAEAFNWADRVLICGANIKNEVGVVVAGQEGIEFFSFENKSDEYLPVVIDTPWARIGLISERDVYRPEVCRTHAIRGVDLILTLAEPNETKYAKDASLTPHWDIAKVRAYENDCFVGISSYSERANFKASIWEPSSLFDKSKGVSSIEEAVSYELCMDSEVRGNVGYNVKMKQLLRQRQPMWY